MAIFVEFERANGMRAVVNIAEIVWVDPSPSGGTWIHLTGGDGFNVVDEYDLVGKALVTGGYG